jgi:hypothetical protein
MPQDADARMCGGSISGGSTLLTMAIALRDTNLRAFPRDYD